MKCGIIPRSDWPACTKEIWQILEQLGCIVVIPNDTIHQSDIFEMNDLDVVIPIGGDGTVLATINGLRNTDIPIFGVHAGTLGFLTNVVPDEFEVAFNHWSTHGKPAYTRNMIQYTSQTSKVHAFNEIAFLSPTVGKIIALHLYINGQFIRSIRGDGLIVSTENGSTAYALSAGSSIVDPNSNVMVIVPNNEFNLAARPIITSRTSTIMVQPITPVVIHKDGIFVEQLNTDDYITIQASSKVIKFADTNTNFFKTVHERLIKNQR